MSEPLKLAIIGAGRMGITHYSIANAHSHAAIAAVADPSLLITTMLGKYAKIATYKDYKGLLKNEALDGVLVCTPPAFNPEILQAVLERRIATFCEKPYVLDAAAGARFAKEFDAAGIVNQVGYVNRWNDMFTKAKALVDDGLLGAPLRFRSEMFSPTIIRDAGEAGWRAAHANGGGAVFEMASHAIDLIAYFFGAPSRVGGTSLSKVYSKQVEDIVSTSLFYDTGAHAGLSGTMYVNWSDASFRKPTNKFEVFGQAGKLLVDQHGMKVHLAQPSERHGLKEGWNQFYITDVASNVPFYVRGIEYTAQLYDFIDAVRAQKAGRTKPVRCTFADAAANLKVIEQLFADDAAQRTKGRDQGVAA
ncbi:MAG: Gfo/Idh/MocA family oxidoreductase [Erythrobacter sp.]|uniref:Gfo/Idh/MocA family protein n=1 Tax=Erythrobacter sp. TaxID=1042 RepID=UPI00261E54A0|nr:Gfo/Idh/MocA family oxidoreductase [Erythrobacter sp.]MDJ0978418.1 Gfo/Idh/MocA family oxidoreductase [Erythrobacter sp.]